MTTEQNQPVSVGRLLAMTPEARAAKIRTLSPIARRKLAHLASLGARANTARALEFLQKGLNDTWIRDQVSAARDHSDLAAALTTEEL